MNTQIQTVIEESRRLNRMREMTERLPPSELRDHTLQRIEIEFKLLKMWLNSVY